MDNVVRIEELPGVIERTLQGIRQGVAAARKDGLLAELPEAVDFNLIVIDKWQELETQGGQTTESEETQGGGTVETSKGTEDSTQERNSQETRQSTETSEQDSKRESEENGTTAGTTQRKGQSGGSTSVDGTRESKDVHNQDNSHNQQTTETYTYDG